MAALVDWASLLFFFGSCVSYLVIIGAAAACILINGLARGLACSHSPLLRPTCAVRPGTPAVPMPATSLPPWLYLLGDAFNLVAARGGDDGWYRAAEGEHYARLVRGDVGEM